MTRLSDPFGRRDSLGRSLKKQKNRSKMSSPGSIESDIASNVEIKGLVTAGQEMLSEGTDLTKENPAKRKRLINSPEKQKDARKSEDKKVFDTIMSLMTQVTSMEKMIKETYNPKKEIKELTMRMSRTCGKLRDMGAPYFEGLSGNPAEERPSVDPCVQTMRDEIIKLKIENDRLNNIIIKNNKDLHEKYEDIKAENLELRGKLKRKNKCLCKETALYRLSESEPINTYAKFVDVADLEWEDGNFTKTEMVEGNPINADDDSVKVVTVEMHDRDMNEGIQKLFKTKYPELGRAKKNSKLLSKLIKE
ncbi:hypothetical protein ABEB36_007970 [Hypothenemus hampei]|uniref:Uncharacterized protein n=1 Tax=Hypothenemus hampei TaxID=57062 RepID=A0ABD1EMD8_HYPHA